MRPRIPAWFVWVFFTISAFAQTSDQRFQKAKQLFSQHDLARARSEFLILEKTESTSSLSRYYLGKIALLETKPAEAIFWLEPIAASNPPLLDSVEQLSKAYFDAGQFVKAKITTERAIQLVPWNGALHYRLGRIYQQLGDPEASRREFSESIRLKSADRESVEMLLQCSEFLSRGATDQATRIAQELLGNSSLDPDVLVALGLAFTGAGMHAESVAPFRKAAERDSNFFQAQYNTGLALLKVGRAADAVPFLLKAQQLGPNLEANSALSLAYFLQSRYADSLAPLENWLRLAPGNSRALNMLGLAYLRTGSATKAIPILRESIRHSPNDPKPYLLLIEGLNASEQQENALKTAEEALKLFPLSAQINLAKAQQLARLGRYREAGPVFARASELAPEQIDPLLGLAETQQKQGDYATSLETYQRALAIDKGDVTACLGAARDLVQLKKLSDARQLLEGAMTARSDNSQLHYELSRVYARLGENQLAAEQRRIVEKLRDSKVKTP